MRDGREREGRSGGGKDEGEKVRDRWGAIAATLLESQGRNQTDAEINQRQMPSALLSGI